VEVRSFSRHFEREEDLAAAIQDCELVVVMRERTPFGASLFSRLPNLKLLITTGMRNAAVDLSAAAEHGVVVCGTGSFSEPPVELTWALILGLARHVVTEAQAFRGNGPWQSTVGVDLNNKQLGLLGLGKIGTKVARVGAAFGMKVVAWSQNLTQERAEAAGVKMAASKEELLESSDFVSIHLVLSARTTGLIGASDLARMRPSAFLVNTSRASIVDQDALVQALQNKTIAGAGLDVFEVEPVPVGDTLRALPNVLATPHLGYVTESNYRVYYREAVEDIVAFLAGVPIRKIS
jgi:phosphoglycerate dehydrogenase-like enzyme